MSAVATVRASCPLCRETPREKHAQGRDFEYQTTGEREWTFFRCSACEVVLLSPRPAAGELARIYPGNYYAYDFTSRKALAYKVKELLDRQAARSYLRYAPAGCRVLDVGCGDGRLLRIFARRGFGRDRLYGMELDGRAVTAARSYGLQVEHGRFEEIDYPSDFFGLVILQQVIEHVPDPRGVLEKLRAILLPGGAAVLETPNTASWDHRLFRKRYWGGYHIPRHFYLFNRRSLPRLLQDCGFEVVEVRSLLSPNFWIQSVHHLIAEHGFPQPLLKFFDPHYPSPLAHGFFTALDLLGRAARVTSNMRVVAVKR